MRHNVKQLTTLMATTLMALLLPLSSVVAADQPHGTWKDAKARNLVIDITTDGGKVAVALMQSAVLLSKLITVTGTGTCSLIPNTETLASLQTTERDLTMSSGR